MSMVGIIPALAATVLAEDVLQRAVAVGEQFAETRITAAVAIASNDGQEPSGLPVAPGFLEAELDLPDQRIRDGWQRGGPLLPLECAALMRSYDALLAGVTIGRPDR
jgi:hypothetical protein